MPLYQQHAVHAPRRSPAHGMCSICECVCMWETGVLARADARRNLQRYARTTPALFTSRRAVARGACAGPNIARTTRNGARTFKTEACQPTPTRVRPCANTHMHRPHAHLHILHISAPAHPARHQLAHSQYKAPSGGHSRHRGVPACADRRAPLCRRPHFQRQHTHHSGGHISAQAHAGWRSLA